MLFHLDLDAFFVSVEEIMNPVLKNRPVIVGADPNSRGVVSACSYEARKYGIHSGMPIREAYRLCPTAFFLRGSFQEYIRYSRLIYKYLSKISPIIEQASVDEFYLDLTGCELIYGNMFDFASKIQSEIKSEFNLNCSIGIAKNKTVAKIASDFNKPLGITFIPEGMEKSFLERLPVEVVPGVGKKGLLEFNKRGIFLISDVLKLDRDYLSLLFGKVGIDLWDKFNGRGVEFLSPERVRKSISQEKTFKQDVIDIEELNNILFTFAEQLSYHLRAENLMYSTITLKLRYTDFITNTRSQTISFSDDSKVIFEVATELLEKCYTRRVGIRLIGINLSNFSKYFFQESLFSEEKTKQEIINGTIDSLRKKYGFDIIGYKYK